MADAEGGSAEPVDVGDAWSVAELNEEIGAALREASDRFPRYVVGEVADVSTYPFGTFFDLRDARSDEEAVISCLAWSSAVEGFETPLEEGVTGVLRATVDFYADRGDCQLRVHDYWPVGESARRRDLEALRASLEAEGLLAADRKRPLPAYPKRVGVVTSLSGSAREDVCTAIRERAPGTDVVLCGATVQGEAAVPSVVAGIERLNRDPAIDVLVVTRGGGADADLWCFNAEPVVRAIADSDIPVVVAVGHEDDTTLAEAVADRRAMTPTDAGVTVTPETSVVREQCRDHETRVDRAYRELVRARLEGLERRLDAGLDGLVETARRDRLERLGRLQRAADLEDRIGAAYDSLARTRLADLERRLDAAVRELEHATAREAADVRAVRGRLADLEARIDGAYRSHVERELAAYETDLDRAYRELEADARIEASAVETRRLKLVVAALVVALAFAVVVFLAVFVL